MFLVRHDDITGKSPISEFPEIDNHADFVNFLEIGGSNFDFLG